MFYGWIVLLVLSFDYFVMLGGVFYTYGTILIPMAEELGMTMTQAALGQSLLAGVEAILVLIVGQLLAKHSPRLFLLVGAAAGMAGSIVMAFFAHSPAAYYFCYAFLFSVMQICGSGVASQVLVARWFNRRRATALAILLSAGGVAGLIFPPLTARLVEMTGTWRSIWWVVWGCCAAAFVLSALLLRDGPAVMGLAPDGSPEQKTVAAKKRGGYRTPVSFTQRQAFVTALFAAGLFAQICVNGAGNSMGNYLIAHLRSAGLAPMVAASVLSTYSAVNIVGRILAGPVLDRIDVRTVLQVGLLGMGLCLFTIPLLTTPAAAFLFAVVFGLFFSFTMMCPMTQVMNYFGVVYYSQIIGVQNMVSTFAKSLTNLAAGQCWDLTGSYGPFFLAIGAACVLGSAWNRFAKVPTPPESQG